jgi:hypothetical protein
MGNGMMSTGNWENFKFFPIFNFIYIHMPGPGRYQEIIIEKIVRLPTVIE